jgi:hypothetical protein
VQKYSRSGEPVLRLRFYALLRLSLIDGLLDSRVAICPAHVGLSPRDIKTGVDAAWIAESATARNYALLILCLRLAAAGSIVQVSLIDYLIWRIRTDYINATN